MSGLKRALKTSIRKLPLFRPEPPGIEDPARLQAFREQFDCFRSLDKNRKMPVEWVDRWPCLDDATANTGFDRHYVLHPAWAARAVARIKPSLHVDFSSTLNFVSQVSAFVPVKFFDYRPAQLDLPGLSTDFADLTRLPQADGSLESVSCMHVVEHVGLGRYGDPLDPDGDLAAIRELKRVTAKGGHLLLVVPVGRSRVQFNAHRIYGYRQILDLFDGFRLEEFALIPDSAEDGNLVVGAPEALVDRQSYGCGCFWFRKSE